MKATKATGPHAAKEHTELYMHDRTAMLAHLPTQALEPSHRAQLFM